MKWKIKAMFETPPTRWHCLSHIKQFTSSSRGVPAPVHGKVFAHGSHDSPATFGSSILGHSPENHILGCISQKKIRIVSKSYYILLRLISLEIPPPKNIEEHKNTEICFQIRKNWNLFASYIFLFFSISSKIGGLKIRLNPLSYPIITQLCWWNSLFLLVKQQVNQHKSTKKNSLSLSLAPCLKNKSITLNRPSIVG